MWVLSLASDGTRIQDRKILCGERLFSLVKVDGKVLDPCFHRDDARAGMTQGLGH